MPFGSTQDPVKSQRNAVANRRESCLAQLCEMQAALRKDVLNPDTKPSERAMSMRAYVEAEKLKRITRGLPANTSQSIRADQPKRGKPQSQPPVLETLPEESASQSATRPTVSPAVSPGEPK